MSKALYLIAGEHSGDIYGAELAKELKRKFPQALLKGVAGPKMRQEGVASHLKMEEFTVMGFTDVLLSLPQLCRKFYTIRNEILKSLPDAVIFIDYPGLNLRLAHSLRKAGYRGKLIHYICPSVWAYGKKRIPKMASSLDLLLTILPFEAEHFNKTNLSVKYVGHPLFPMIPKIDVSPPEQPLIALFPGSRPKEIKRNLPKQLQAAALFSSKRANYQFAICCVDQQSETAIRKECLQQSFLKKEKLLFVPGAERYALMQRSEAAIAKSGTVTLELALQNCPTVVTYELTRFNRFIAQYILKLNLPYYCIVNILGNKSIFPELIEESPTPERISAFLEKITYDKEKRSHCLKECRRVKDMLKQESNPSLLAAEEIACLLL